MKNVFEGRNFVFWGTVIVILMVGSLLLVDVLIIEPDPSIE
jgi:hypothetical protein